MTVAGIFRKVQEQATVQGVEAAIGAENVDFAGHKAPRMCWVPTIDPFKPGWARTSIDGQQLHAVGLKPFLTRLAHVQIHLWSKSTVARAGEVEEIEACEELLRRVLCALRETAAGSFTAVDFAHSGGNPKGQEITEFGRYGILTVIFEVPIYKRAEEVPYTTAVATTMRQTGQMDFPPEGQPAGPEDATGTPSP